MTRRNDENDTQRPNYATDCSNIKAPPGEGCPRCGGAVFAAEQMLAKGSVSALKEKQALKSHLCNYSASRLSRVGTKNVSRAPSAGVH